MPIYVCEMGVLAVAQQSLSLRTYGTWVHNFMTLSFHDFGTYLQESIVKRLPIHGEITPKIIVHQKQEELVAKESNKVRNGANSPCLQSFMTSLMSLVIQIVKIKPNFIAVYQRWNSREIPASLFLLLWQPWALNWNARVIKLLGQP